VRKTIHNDEVWKQCKNFEHMFEPILKALQVFNRHIQSMAKA
jgi:hypothetical protein